MTSELAYDQETMVRQAGISYRQLDYWTTKGYLETVRGSRGTGWRRLWPRSEAITAMLMNAFTHFGMRPERAIDQIRKILDEDGNIKQREVQVFPGVTLRLDDLNAVRTAVGEK